MEKSKTKNKILNISKFMAVIFKIGKILSTIGIIGSIIGLFGLLIVNWTWLNDFLNNLNIYGIIIDEIDYAKQAQYSVNITASLLGCISSLVSCTYLYRFFKGIVKHETPFTDEAVYCLNKIAIYTIVFAIIIPVTMGIIVGIVNLFDYNVDYNFEGFNLAISIVLFAVALIFKYGVELQRENDATL